MRSRPAAESEVGAAVLHELDGFDDAHLDCTTNSASYALRHHGADPRVLGEHWGYRYAQDGAACPILRLEIARRPQSDRIWDWYGLATRMVDHDDGPALWEFVRSVIDDGRVAIVDVDLYEWGPSSFYGQLHYPHRVVIADLVRDEALMLDGRAKTRFAGWVPLPDAERAVDAPALATVPLEFGEAAPRRTIDLIRRGTGDDGPEHLRSALRAAVTEYWSTGSDGTHRHGHEALVTMAEDLAAYLDAGPDALEGQDMMSVVAVLGGPSTQWQLAALFAQKAGAELGIDLDEDAERFSAIAVRWTKVFNTLRLGYHVGRPHAVLLGRARERVLSIAQDEHAAMTAFGARLGL